MRIVSEEVGADVNGGSNSRSGGVESEEARMEARVHLLASK
jgi:hypothetical protein